MSTGQHIATLVDWATQHGAHLHPSVEVYHNTQTGLSFRVKPSAAAPLQPFEDVVTIPSTITLSYLNASQGTQPFSAQLVAGLPPHVVGRLVLVREYLYGEDSFWWPYIQALPQPNDRDAWALPSFWPDDDVELLDGTNVDIGIKKIRSDVKSELEEAQRLLNLHEGGSGLAQSLSAHLYQWAYCIFSSRSFRPSLVLSEAQQAGLPAGVKPDDFSVLLPLFDIGNHDMSNSVRWDVQGAEESNLVSLKVGKEHQPGEQVFNNYSMKTNAELLLGYGFMVPATEQLHGDYVHVRKRGNVAATDEYLISLRPMSHPSSALGRSKQPAEFSSLAGLEILSAFQHVQPDMVWDIFCTLATPEQRAQLIPGGEDEQSRQRKFFTGQVSADCRLFLEQTAAVIQHKVLQELERLDETDFEVAGAGELEKNQKLALDYRERCRRVLENTLEAMNADEVLGQDEG